MEDMLGDWLGSIGGDGIAREDILIDRIGKYQIKIEEAKEELFKLAQAYARGIHLSPTKEVIGKSPLYWYYFIGGVKTATRR